MFNNIQQLQMSISNLSSGNININSFCQLWRGQSELLHALPPQFAEVMENLLSRMEASSMFTEESCSFSQADLISQLKIWLDKAATRLEK